MKRVSKTKENVVQTHERYLFKNSPQSLTLESEIKRVAVERVESIGLTIERLSKFSGVTERQIYNYIGGKTDIPSGMIPVFCREFGSNVLAMTILRQCEPCEELEDYDLVKLANQSGQITLGVHQHFLEVFEDGKIDGFEFTETKRKTAKAVSCFQRLEQVVEDSYKRNLAA